MKIKLLYLELMKKVRNKKERIQNINFPEEITIRLIKDIQLKKHQDIISTSDSDKKQTFL